MNKITMKNLPTSWTEVKPFTRITAEVYSDLLNAATPYRLRNAPCCGFQLSEPITHAYNSVGMYAGKYGTFIKYAGNFYFAGTYFKGAEEMRIPQELDQTFGVEPVKIIRTFGGVEFSFALTEDEVCRAFEYQTHRFDMEGVFNYLDAQLGSDDEFSDSLIMMVMEDNKWLSAVAAEFRSRLNGNDSDYDSTLEETVREYLKAEEEK